MRARTPVTAQLLRAAVAATRYLGHFPSGTARAQSVSSKVHGVHMRQCTNTRESQNQEQSEISIMKLTSLVMTAGVAILMCLNTAQLQAQGRQGGQGGPPGQGRGNFDPDQMRQRMMEGVRAQFDVKNDAEWQIIEKRVNQVWEARRDVGAAGAGGMRMMARRPQGGDQPAGQGARRFGGEPSAEEEALQKAIDSNASTAELKSAIAKYRESRKQKEAALEKAQQELKEVLNVKQEAVALSMGLIN
jgi:hypothetical protein